MRYLRIIFAMLAVFACAASLAYALLVLTTRPVRPTELVSVNTAEIALTSLGIPYPTWQTMILTASRDVSVPATDMWIAWSSLEDWPAWNMRVVSARWLSETPWAQGSQFVEELDLGFPLGEQDWVETVIQVNPGVSAEWCRDANGIKSCHIWMFETLPDGSARVTNTEVLHGASVAALKPLVGARWQRQFDEAVDGLVARVITSR